MSAHRDLGLCPIQTWPVMGSAPGPLWWLSLLTFPFLLLFHQVSTGRGEEFALLGERLPLPSAQFEVQLDQGPSLERRPLRPSEPQQPRALINNPPLRCDICRLPKRSAFLLARHQAAVHVRRTNPPTCPDCGGQFTTQNAMIAHRHVEHLGIKPYHCLWPDCGHRSVDRFSCVRHVRVVHFKLPVTVKKQEELGIDDERRALDWVEWNDETRNGE